MTNPDESIDYLNRLEGPIVEALAAMEAGRLPHAIKVGEAFLAAKNIVVKDAIKTNTGRKGDNWSNWLSRICKRQKISVRTAHDYMLLARHPDVSQRAASVRHALEQIAAKREAEGKKRAAPPAKSTKSAAASPDLTELLRNVGPDELRDALRAADWEPAALRELRDYIDEMLDKSLQHLRSGRPTHDRLKGGQRERQRLTEGDAVTASLSCPFVDAALAEHPDHQGADAIKSEVLSMRWGDLDLTAGTWHRKAADLKQGRDHSVPLSPPALTILSALRDEQTANGKRALGEFVFPSAVSTTRHLVEVRRLWRNVVKTADLGDLRLHDLRHSFASQLVSSGASLALIGSLLGHSSPAVTARYSHLFDSVERDAVTRVGAIIEAAGLDQPPSAPVISLSDQRRQK